MSTSQDVDSLDIVALGFIDWCRLCEEGIVADLDSRLISPLMLSRDYDRGIYYAGVLISQPWPLGVRQ